MKALIARSLCPWLAPPMGRLIAAAGRGRLGHGWLISGPDGIGKRNLAYAMAARLLDAAGDAMLPTAGPRAIAAACDEIEGEVDLHPDLHRVRHEEDRQSISIDQIRALTADVALTPHAAAAKLVVIETADTMTPDAANALLKSLEEPTANTFFFLLAERPGRLPATVRSRCQHLSLKGPALEAARVWLAGDGIAADELPAALLQRQPIAAARLVLNPDDYSKYNELQNNIRLLLNGGIDAFSLAESWAKGDTAVALSALIERLRAAIRTGLVPTASNLVTDGGGSLQQNAEPRIAVDVLFAGLQMAENLREQLGRGLNVELALKSILVGIERGDTQRVNS